MTNNAFLRRRTVLGAMAVCPILARSSAVWGQTLSDRPLRFILPMAAGSVGDALARGMTSHLTQALKRPVVVENLPGAGGMTGTAQLVRAPADGSALALVSTSHVINPFVFKAMPYDPIKDVTPITVIGKSMMVLVVNPAVPAQNLAEFVRLLKASPGKLNYGSSGNGGVTHLPAEMFHREAGVSARHIPYKGLSAQVTDIIAGVVEYGFVPVGVAVPQLKAGKLRALAVTGAVRSPMLSQVPTIKEGGLASYVYEPWLAIIGPAGLTATQTQSLYGDVRTTLEQEEMRTMMDAQDMTPVTMTPKETATYFRSEMAEYGALANYAGLRAE